MRWYGSWSEGRAHGVWVVVLVVVERCRVQCFALRCVALLYFCLYTLSCERLVAKASGIGESSRPPLAKLYLRSRAACMYSLVVQVTCMIYICLLINSHIHCTICVIHTQHSFHSLVFLLATPRSMYLSHNFAPVSFLASSLRMRFKILPDAFLGIASTHLMPPSSILYDARRSLI